MAAARAPAWKVVPGCGFAVDAFRHASDPAIAAFFLSHAHSGASTVLNSTSPTRARVQQWVHAVELTGSSSIIAPQLCARSLEQGSCTGGRLRRPPNLYRMPDAYPRALVTSEWATEFAWWGLVQRGDIVPSAVSGVGSAPC